MTNLCTNKTISQLRAENALIDKGYAVTIQWDRKSSQKGHPSVEVLCHECGTSSVRVTHSLRQGQYECKQCVANNYKTLLGKCGFVYLSHGKGITNIACALCNNCSVISSSTPTKGHVPKCDVCLQDKYKKQAITLGFDFVKKFNPQGPSKTLVTLLCKTCQSELTLQSGALMAGYARCKRCQEQTYIDALLTKNCTFISSVSVPHRFCKGENVKMITYKNPQGEIFERSSGLVITNQFATTKDNAWTAEHSTYLIVNIVQGKTFCKIGTANIPEERLKRLKIIGESEVITLASFSDRFGADNLESELHKEFKQFKLDPEVAKTFTGAKTSVKRVGHTNRVYTKDGVTEWFTHEVYDILKTRYNLTEGSANGS